LKKQWEEVFLSKVPEITIWFWVTKVLTTGMGEVFSDYLFFNKFLEKETVLEFGAAGLVLALLLQLFSRRYVAWVYWLAVVAVSIFGTMFADFIHEALGLNFMGSTVLFLLFQVSVFAVWYGAERTLSIHSIRTFRREVFYWATVLGTFALGTAAGDMTAISMEWGAFVSGAFFTGMIAVPAIGCRFWGWNRVASFWFAYVMTRPLGASFSDWMAHDLHWGTGPVSLGMTLIIVVLVGYLSITKKDITAEVVATDTDIAVKQ